MMHGHLATSMRKAVMPARVTHLKKGFASLMRVNQSLSRDLMIVLLVMKPLPQLIPAAGGRGRRHLHPAHHSRLCKRDRVAALAAGLVEANG